MDLKSEDIFNVDFDPALLLSYELDKLNLENIPNDIFELPDEIQKNEDHADAENAVLCVEDNKVTEATNSLEDRENNDFKTAVTDDKSCAEELKFKVQLVKKKDINGNEEPSHEETSPDENLNQLLDKLVLSDSDNEENDEEDCSTLRERGPIVRPRRRASKNQDSNYLSRSESYDRSQFDSQKLKFWCGSNHVQLNDTITTNQCTIHNNLSSVFSGSQAILSLPTRDSFYDDARANSVGSPESGYESSITGSPPGVSLPASVSPFLDLIPESVDEQNLLDFLAENTTECALTDHNVSRCVTDDRDPTGRIIKIINFLKDTPAELNELSSPVASSDNSSDYVPLVNNSQDLNTYSVTLSSLPKNVEAPKKLVYKLENKAKTTLREFLARDEFYAAKTRIYRKINDDIKNKKEVKVIYVEDEMDKASENRTNLHLAVLNSNIEEIYCLVEIHKQYNKPFKDINIRDRYGKTALDYAIQNDMNLVVDYLRENTACQSVNI